MPQVFLSRIIVEPDVCNGNAHIRGTTVEVAAILDKIARGATIHEIIGDWPVLTLIDLQSAAAYAAKLIREANAQGMGSYSEESEQ